jgi:Ca-activated chloride channel family protein
MKFAEPYWLLAGAAVIAAMLVLYRAFDLRQRAALAEFASSHLLDKLTASFSPGRRVLKRLLLLAALACAFTALARPQWGFHWEEEKQRGIDILFAVDTSKSMLTQDVTPDRLTRAKLATIDFVRKLEGDRVGLIAFAGEAFLQAPLTLDYDAFQESLEAIDTTTIPLGGTDISSAIDEAQSAFGPGRQNKKILILITDGEDLEARGIDSARAAAKDGMVIYTVGVGSASGGLIPVPNPNGGTDFVKDDSGQYVKSHLDESTLKQIAEATGGIYEPLGQQGEGLQAIYDKALASLPKQELSSKREMVFEERFQWPLAAALVLLLASVLIGTRRRDARKSAGTMAGAAAGRTATAAAVRAVTLAALVLIPATAHASLSGAKQAYKNGDYEAAEKQYEKAAEKNPQLAQLQFNVGAAAYKNSEYEKALPAFQKALNTDDIAVQEQAYYNIGNTQFRRGQKTVKQSPQETIKTWENSVDAFDAALKLKPDDADAKFNRDIVQKKLDKLKKDNPQNQDKKDQDKKDQDQKDQQNQPDQNQQNQDPSRDQKQGRQDQPNKDGSKNDQQDKQNGQQNQDKQGGPQDQKQPNGQDQAQQPNKDGQPKTAGNQDAKQQPGGKPDEKKDEAGKDQQQQTAQNDQKPGGDKGQASAAGQDKDKPPPQQAQAEEAVPGKMSKEEAKDLLDSLKNGEHALPVTADARTGSAKPQDRGPVKDW